MSWASATGPGRRRPDDSGTAGTRQPRTPLPNDTSSGQTPRPTGSPATNGRHAVPATLDAVGTRHGRPTNRTASHTVKPPSAGNPPPKAG